MKILIAEDNESIFKMLEIRLRQEKFNIEHAKDGEIALEKIKRNKYDLIILDIILPKKNGFSIITTIRSLGNQTPILAISSSPLVNSRIKAINLGANDFLVKDFDLDELAARAKGLLRKKDDKLNNILHCKNLTVDFTNMDVFYKQKRVPLTKKEFQILMLLLRNKNTLVTREELREFIWNGQGGDELFNTMTVHIRSLRKKLKSEKNLIETVYKYGYIIRT
jgi:DNA-binding response OmpR family regulator